MNGNTGGPGPAARGTLAVIATIAVLATACGVHFSFSGGPASTRSATFRAELAYALASSPVRAHSHPNKRIGAFPHQRAPTRKNHQPQGPRQ